MASAQLCGTMPNKPFYFGQAFCMGLCGGGGGPRARMAAQARGKFPAFHEFAGFTPW